MVRKKNTDLPAFARQEVKISVNGPHNVPPERFLWKRKVMIRFLIENKSFSGSNRLMRKRLFTSGSEGDVVASAQ